jgi:hypothetical protein
MSVGTLHAPKLLLHGKAATEAVTKVLPTAHAITVSSPLGFIELKPGTIFNKNKFLVSPTPMSVIYTVDDRLYEYGTQDFLRTEYLNALSTGAAHAMPMVYLAKVECEFLMGIFVPWYGMLGLTVAKAGLTYVNHKPAFERAWEKAPAVCRLLQDLRLRKPTLFRKLLHTGAREVLVDMRHGISMEDVAFFVGRCIRGGAVTPKLVSPARTIGPLIVMIGYTAACVGAIHAPGIAVHGVAAAGGKTLEQLKAQLAHQGIHVTSEEANIIVREIMADHEGMRKLQELREALEIMLPTLEELAAGIDK